MTQSDQPCATPLMQGALDLQWAVYYFPGAAQITINWVAENKRNVFSHRSGGEKPEIELSAGLSCLHILGRESFLVSSSFGWLRAFLAYGCIPPISASIFTWSFLVWVFSFFSSLLRTPVIGFGAHLHKSGWYNLKLVNVIISTIILFPNKVMLIVSRD